MSKPKCNYCSGNVEAADDTITTPTHPVSIYHWNCFLSLAGWFDITCKTRKKEIAEKKAIARMAKQPSVTLTKDQDLVASILEIKPHQVGQLQGLVNVMELNPDVDHVSQSSDLMAWYDNNNRVLSLPATAYKKWIYKARSFAVKDGKTSDVKRMADSGLWGDIDG